MIKPMSSTRKVALFNKGHWFELRDGGSDQWLEIKHLRGRVYLFIDIIDLHSVCGEDSGTHYAGDVSMVDLDQLSARQIANAKESMDFESWAGEQTDQVRLNAALAECCHDYGSKAPLMNLGSNSLKEVKRKARGFAKLMLNQERLDNHLDDHTVNAIGDSARSYMQGGYLFKKDGSGPTVQEVRQAYRGGDVTPRFTTKPLEAE